MNNHKFQLKLFNPKATPFRSTAMAAAYDVFACNEDTVVLKRGDKATLIPLGFACFMNDGAVAGLILPRSGLGHKEGLTLGNTVGVIDGDFQNQWFASAWNRGQQEEISIAPGTRLCQIMFVPVIHPEFVAVSEFSTDTERGLGGFGSTGKGVVEGTNSGGPGAPYIPSALELGDRGWESASA